MERVIALHPPQELVLRRILSKDRSSLMDIGAGTGGLIREAIAHHPRMKIVAVELDSQLSRCIKEEFPLAHVVTADILSLKPLEEQVSLAVAVNVCHEACAAPSVEQRKAKCTSLVQAISASMTSDGELILFDGIMPEDKDTLVNLRPNSSDAQAKLEEFIRSYRAKTVNFQQVEEGVFASTIEDCITFFTKLSYIGTSVWEGEAQQLYPFLSLKDMTSVLEATNFEILEIAYPSKRLGMRRFLEQFSVEGYNEENFPRSQAMIHARKRVSTN